MPLAQEGEKSIKVAFNPLWDSTLRLLGRFIRMQTCEIVKRGEKRKKVVGEKITVFVQFLQNRIFNASNSFSIKHMVLNCHRHEKDRITEFNDSTVDVIFTHEVKFTYPSPGPPSFFPHHTLSPASSHLHTEGPEQDSESLPETGPASC